MFSFYFSHSGLLLVSLPGLCWSGVVFRFRRNIFWQSHFCCLPFLHICIPICTNKFRLSTNRNYQANDKTRTALWAFAILWNPFNIVQCSSREMCVLSRALDALLPLSLRLAFQKFEYESFMCVEHSIFFLPVNYRQRCRHCRRHFPSSDITIDFIYFRRISFSSIEDA